LLALQIGLIAALIVAAAVLGWAVVRRRAAPAVAAERDRLSVELSRRIAELSAFQGLSQVLASSLRLDRVATEVAQYAMRLASGRGAAVVLTALDGPRMEVAAAHGTLEHCRGRVLEEDDGMVASVIGHERPERAGGDAPGPARLCGDLTVDTAAVVPLRAHGLTTGALVVADRSEGAFTDDDVRLLSAVATHAAVVLANLRFFDMIRRGKEQWEATFDALASGVALIDGEARIQRANDSLAELLGLPVREVIGRHLCHALFGEHETLSALVMDARSGRRPVPLLRRSEPLGRILKIAAAPVAHPEGDADVVVVIEDVTEQKAMETQLIQSEKMAVVGTLVSGVAHELNNPLTSIAGLTEFLLERAGSAAADREHLRVINDQAQRASRIVRNLLTFARKGPAELGPVDMADVVQRTTQLMAYDLKLREIAVEVHAAAVPPVLGNRDELQQVVLNLLTNAVQALEEVPEGLVRRIAVTIEARSDEVAVRVEDSGPGIPPDVLPHIFDPFFTTKAPGEGTGLGLFISYGIVESHGGSLTAAPATGGGAVFELALPTGARAPRRSGPHGRTSGPVARTSGPHGSPARSAEALSPPVANGDATRGGPMRRILVVDDDPTVCRVVSALFTHDGHQVDAAGSGSEGLRLAERTDYDLVVADRRAESGGRSFAAALLELRPGWSDRLLVSSSDPRAAELAGSGVRMLQKPFNLRDLRAAAAAAWPPPDGA
jgi:two-component system NtrC family sensor kinase